MAKVGLSAYSITIQQSDDDGNIEFMDLNSILPNNNFLDLITKLIEENQVEYQNDTANEKIFKFETHELDSYTNQTNLPYFDFIFGEVKTGDYGIESEIINTDSGEIVYQRTEYDADVKPFNFLFAIPNRECRRGILLLQTVGRYGIKTTLTKNLKAYFKRIGQASDLKLDLELGNIAPIEYVRRIFDRGQLSKIRVIKYHEEEDVSELLENDYGFSATSLETIIHKPSGVHQLLERALNVLERPQHNTINQLISIGDLEYDDLKFEFNLGRSKKTINLRNLDSLMISQDVTDEVIIEGGHPTSESIKPVMIETAAQYLAQLGVIFLGDE